MKITREILDAIDRAVDQSGSVYRFAKELGVAHSTVLFWRSGKTSSIKRRLWDSKMKKILKPYLTSGYAQGSESAGIAVREKTAEYGQRPRKYPLVPFSSLRAFDPHVTSTADFVRTYSSGSAYFSSRSVSGGLFAVEIDSSRFDPLFPEGSVFLTDTGRPPVNGEMVIAKPCGCELPSFYRFQHTSATFELLPCFPGADQKISWEEDTRSSSYFEWIYPVLEANLKFNPL